ncbi:regulatory protein RecX [Desulfocicer niacini]
MKKHKTAEITPARTYDICLRFLAPRPRSVAEMQRHLTKKEIPPGLMDLTLEKLMNENLLNDEEFARMFVESRERHKPRSRFALGCELRQKGIEENIIDQILEGMDEQTSAWNAVRSRLRSWQHLDMESLRKKVFNYLRYRGFGYEISLNTWNSVVSEMEKPKHP